MGILMRLVDCFVFLIKKMEFLLIMVKKFHINEVYKIRESTKSSSLYKLQSTLYTNKNLMDCTNKALKTRGHLYKNKLFPGQKFSNCFAFTLSTLLLMEHYPLMVSFLPHSKAPTKSLFIVPDMLHCIPSHLKSSHHRDDDI